MLKRWKLWHRLLLSLTRAFSRSRTVLLPCARGVGVNCAGLSPESVGDALLCKSWALLQRCSTLLLPRRCLLCSSRIAKTCTTRYTHRHTHRHTHRRTHRHTHTFLDIPLNILPPFFDTPRSHEPIVFTSTTSRMICSDLFIIKSSCLTSTRHSHRCCCRTAHRGRKRTRPRKRDCK